MSQGDRGGGDTRPGPTRARRRAARPAGVLVVTLAVIALVATIAVRASDSPGGASVAHFSGAPEVSPLPTEIGLRKGWNSSAFINDNLWTEKDYQFVVWIGADGDPMVGRRHLAEPGWQSVDLGSLPGNPLDAPTVADPHNAYAVGVDEAGYVHVAGNMHANPLRYVRSTRPYEIDTWEPSRMTGNDEGSVSYPAFARVPGGPLLFFYRDGISGRGDVVLNRLDVSAGSWNRVGTLIDGRSSDESPYLQRVAVDSVRRSIHVMYLWRSEGAPATNRDVSYLRSDDGGTTWRRSDRSVVQLPVTHQTADVVAPTGRGTVLLVNQGALAIDDTGQPHAVFRVDSGAPSGADVVHVWHEAERWRTEPVDAATSMVGRPALVGGGRDALLLVWLQRSSSDESDLRVARLAGRETTGSVELARLPVTRWEPTFDSAALERGQLRMLMPISRGQSRESANAAVVTWSTAALPPA